MKGKTIAKFVHIKNSSVVLSPEILVQKSHSFGVLVKKLYCEGYILTFKSLDQKSASSQSLAVVPTNSTSFSNFKTYSTPSKKKYLKSSDLANINTHKDTFFVSTASGVQTVFECKRKRLGGVLLFTC